jgi:phosphoglucomutase
MNFAGLQLYRKSLQIKSFQTLENSEDIDLNSPVGTIVSLTESSKVTIIDPFEDYIKCLQECFDFEALRNFVKREDFSILFDAMHGAGGPFAKRILIEELGLPEVSYSTHSCVNWYLSLNYFSSRNSSTSKSLLYYVVIHFQILDYAIPIPILRMLQI